jgi:hypothetical protein
VRRDNLAMNLAANIRGLTPSVRDVFGRFLFGDQIVRLQRSGLLYQVTKFVHFQLHPAPPVNDGMAFGMGHPSASKNFSTE